MTSRTQLKQYKNWMRRGRATTSERVLLSRLLQEGIESICQCVIGFYIADFVIPSRMVVLEVDGSSHDRKQDYDARRDGFLSEMGFSVIRIRNQEAATFDLGTLNIYPEHDLSRFKSALKRANLARAKSAKQQPEPTTLQGRCRRPVCRACGHLVDGADWKRFKNGTVHLVWWCRTCRRQAAGNPMPKEWASLFGAESYEQAHARLTLAAGEGW